MKQSVHWNGNLMCAIDCETTGLIPGHHEIIQFACIPLAPDFSVSREVPVFETKIRPSYPENTDPEAITVTKKLYESCMAHGIDKYDAADAFEEYVKRLKLPEKKKIIPLGHNIIRFDIPFIETWLGREHYAYLFSHDPRDTMQAALFMNDRADWCSHEYPFPRFGLTSICNKLGIQILDAHDAMADALAASQAYQRLMRLQVGPSYHPTHTQGTPTAHSVDSPDTAAQSLSDRMADGTIDPAAMSKG
jgi:DNA polymerase III epsilon subunit-like protein